MKRTTFFLAFLVASAISTIAMATTNYYILVGNVWVTSDNASNVTSEHIISGTVSYNASTNTLTLKNVVIDCKNKAASSGINVQTNAPWNLTIMLEGENVIRNTNAVPVQLRKSNKAKDDTGGDFHIYGTGSLNVEDGVIGCYDGATLDLGEYFPFDYYEGNWKPTSGPTINALAIRGNNNENNILRIGACFTTLTGLTYGQQKSVTVDGFKDVYQTIPDCGIYLPPGNGDKITYDTTNKYIPDANGDCLGTTVYLGWKRYGLRVGGVEVTVINNKKFFTKGSTPCEFSYDPDKETLYMLSGYSVRTTGEPAIVNTGSNLTIQFEQTSMGTISFQSTDDVCISSTRDIAFVGKEDVEFDLELTGTYALKMEEEHRTLQFKNLHSFTPLYPIDMANGQLNLSNCDEITLTTAGTKKLQGASQLNLTGMEISTAVFFNPSTQTFGYYNLDGQYNEYLYWAVIRKVKEYYGIRIANHELNDINANNFYYSNVKGTLTYDKDANLLTMDNFTADAGQVQSIYIASYAPENVHIKLVGENILNNAEHYIGISTRKNFVIEGTGTLTLNNDIECFDGSGLTISEGCTVNATRLLGRDNNGGILNLNKATINLTGENNSHTIHGFKNVFYDAYGVSDSSGRSFVTTPNAAHYDQTDQVFKMFDGTIITGTMKFEPATPYHISLNGIYVHDKNCDDILRDVPHTGRLSYNPETRVLKMEDLSFVCNSDRFDKDLNLDDNITIQLNGNNEIKKLTFGMNIYYRLGEKYEVNIEGPGSLQTDGAIWVMANHSVPKQLTIKDCSLKAAAIIVYANSDLDDSANASLTISNANVQLEGNYTYFGTQYTAIEGFDNLTLDYVEFVQPIINIYYEPTIWRCMRTIVASKYYGDVEIVPIRVTVEDITNLIDRYLEGEADITVEDITNLIDRYLTSGDN